MHDGALHHRSIDVADFLALCRVSGREMNQVAIWTTKSPISDFGLIFKTVLTAPSVRLYGYSFLYIFQCIFKPQNGIPLLLHLSTFN